MSFCFSLFRQRNMSSCVSISRGLNKLVTPDGYCALPDDQISNGLAGGAFKCYEERVEELA